MGFQDELRAAMADVAETLGIEVSIRRVTRGAYDPSINSSPIATTTLGDRVKAVLEGPAPDFTPGPEGGKTRTATRTYTVAATSLATDPRPGDTLIEHALAGDKTRTIHDAQLVDHDSAWRLVTRDNA